MGEHKRIWEKTYQIGGSPLSEGGDCSIYLIDVGNGSSVMIDCGAGSSCNTLLENIRSIGLEPEGLNTLVLTHCHIDHIGSARKFQEQFGCKIIAHEGDAEAIEGKDDTRTAASWYGVRYEPVTIDIIITGDSKRSKIGDKEFNFIHTPGHTPGSISVYCDIAGKRVLFGQDIHGPFDPSFGSDINAWRESMRKLLELEADILCEGHYGVFQPKKEVRRYIQGYLDRYSE